MTDHPDPTQTEEDEREQRELIREFDAEDDDEEGG